MPWTSPADAAAHPAVAHEPNGVDPAVGRPGVLPLPPKRGGDWRLVRRARNGQIDRVRQHNVRDGR